MSKEVEVTGVVESRRQYVCFVKSRPGVNFRPYTEKDSPDTMVVKPMREFLDHEISRWFKASESEKMTSAVLLKISADQFFADVDKTGIKSILAAMLGWNYAEAARIVESEGCVLILTAHPRYESIPYSFCRVRDDDDYALAFVEKLLSVRGGQIAFEEHDSEKHVAGYQYLSYCSNGIR